MILVLMLFLNSNNLSFDDFSEEKLSPCLVTNDGLY